MKVKLILVYILLSVIGGFSYYQRRPRDVIFSNDPKQYDYITAQECEIYAGYYQSLNWYWADSPHHCSRYCDEYGWDCTHYIFVGRYGKCYLKYGLVSSAFAYPKTGSGHVCGINCHRLNSEECREIMKHKRWIPKLYAGPPTNMLRSTGCFFNNDSPILSFHNVTLQQCVDECRAIQACTHYNFFFGDNCDLFQGDISPDDMEKCQLPFCHCGLDCQSIQDKRCMYVSPQTNFQLLPGPEPMRLTYNLVDYQHNKDKNIETVKPEY